MHLGGQDSACLRGVLFRLGEFSVEPTASGRFSSLQQRRQLYGTVGSAQVNGERQAAVGPGGTAAGLSGGPSCSRGQEAAAAAAGGGGGAPSNSSKPQHLQSRSLQAPWPRTCSSPVSMLLLAAVARAALAARSSSSHRSCGGARVCLGWKMQSSGHCCAVLRRVYWSPCLCFS